MQYSFLIAAVVRRELIYPVDHRGLAPFYSNPMSTAMSVRFLLLRHSYSYGVLCITSTTRAFGSLRSTCELYYG